MPSIIVENDLGILNLISESAFKNDSGVLLLAAIRLVFLNTVRAVPHYLGTFIIINEIKKQYKDPSPVLVYSPFLLIPVVYILINQIYLIDYDFGVPAYLSIILILIIYMFTKEIKDYTAKFIIIFLFIFGFQWFDVIPALSTFHFGKGELSITIKLLSQVLDASHILNFFSSIFALFIIISALIISRIYITNFRRIQAVKEKRDKEIQIKKLRLKRVEDRVDKEMRYLVHDLKTPLTTIKGLNDVIYYSTNNKNIKEHTNQISKAADNMQNIILEINNKDIQTITYIEVFVNMLKSQLSGENYSGIVKISNKITGQIKINKMRLIRAIVNLVDNSLDAIRKKYKDKVESKGEIEINFLRNNDMLIIQVKDNGIGIESENLEKLNLSYLKKIDKIKKDDFLGIGIEFVKKVISEHDGFIDAKSIKNQGTCINIYIPLI